MAKYSKVECHRNCTVIDTVIDRNSVIGNRVECHRNSPDAYPLLQESIDRRASMRSSEIGMSIPSMERSIVDFIQ